MKKKTGIIISMLFVTVISFGVYNFIVNQKYVNQISSELGNDLATMYYTLAENEKVYGEILSSNVFTYEQFDRINNFHFIEGVRKWEIIAKNFNRAKSDELQDLTATTMMKSNDIFYERLWDVGKEYDIKDLNLISTVLDKKEKISLNNEQLEYIKLMKEFNDSLLNRYIDHIDGIDTNSGKLVTDEFFTIYSEKGFKRNDWVMLLVSWNELTKEFLMENRDIDNLKEILSNHQL